MNKSNRTIWNKKSTARGKRSVANKVVRALIAAGIVSGSSFAASGAFAQASVGQGGLELCGSASQAYGVGGQGSFSCSTGFSFSLNNAADVNGAGGFGASTARVTGYGNGVLELMGQSGISMLNTVAMNNNKITDLAAGTISSTSADAVNGSQLFGLASSTASALGGGSTVNPDGTITAPQYTVGGQTFNNAGDAFTNLDNRTTANSDAITNLQAATADAVMYDSSAHDSVTLGGVGSTTPVALHNVAGGAVNATSTDAVNGSQLYGLASSTASAMGGGSTVNPDGTITAPQYTVGGQTFNNAGDAFTNLDNRTTTNTDAIANLQAATADAVVYDSSAHDSVTFGGVGATTPVALHNVAAGALTATSTDAVNGSQLYATNQQVAQNTADISKNTSDISNLQSNVTNLQNQAANSVSYDSDAHDSLTLGGAGATTPVGLHNVAAGTADTDAVNVGQMNDALAAVSQEATNAANPFVAANGDRATEGAVASGVHATAVGPNATASADNSVALGAGSVADRANTVSVGSAGNERQITNVAAGTAGTDAVNVDQLNAATSQSQAYVDSRVNGMQSQIDDAKKTAFGAAAAAMAVAALPQPTAPGKTMVAAGTSRIAGQTGMALGVSYVTENNKWVGKLSASSSSQGNTGVTMAAGYQW